MRGFAASRRARWAVALVVCLLAGGGAFVLLGQSDAPRDAAAPDDPDAAAREVLEPWYDALAGHATDPAEVVVVGDSISEGALLPTPVHARRMVTLLQDGLRRQVGASGGAGYLPAYYADRVTRDDTARTGAPARELSFGKWGLGGRALLMPHTSAVTYPALEADRVRVWYGLTPLLGGAATVHVDGVDVTARGALSTGEPSGEVVEGAMSTSRSGVWWESPVLAEGPHAVTVTSVRPGTAFVHTGVEFLAGDEDSGVHVYEAAHSGAAAVHFAAETVQEGHWSDVAAIDPDLVVVNLGTNPEPDYAGNLATVVDRALEAAPDAVVLVVDGWQARTWPDPEWEAVRAARAAVAAEHPDRVAVFDLASRWRAAEQRGEELMVEVDARVHPNAAGNRVMASLLLDVLTPRE